MKRLMIVVLLLSNVVAFSQQNRFVFIQAGPQQPFYVRMGERSFSSSSFGHLVIPKLSDSTYTIFIGFPRNQVPEQEFSINLNGKDRGFDLKVENINQLILFDWQKSERIASRNPPAPTQETTYKIQRRTDSYALLMAGVVNDSLVLVSIQKSEEPVAKSVSSPTLPDTVTITKKQLPTQGDTISGVNNKTAVKNEQDLDPIQNDTLAIAKKSQTVESSIVVDSSQRSPSQVTIRLISEKSGPEEKLLVYIDGAGVKADTINVVISREFEVIVDSSPSLQETDTGNATGSNPVADSLIKVSTAKDPIISKEPLYRPKDTSNTEKDSTVSSIVLMNSDCTRFATDQDVDKLRVLLLKENEDDDKAFVAKKVFRTKCFTTKQVRALTELFSGEPSKYMFLDAAYPFVSDSGNFKTLVSLFSDPYYINRFKALVRM